MKDYIDIANDKASVYEKALFVIVGLGILGGLFISFSLSQEMVFETSELLGQTIEYEMNFGLFLLYALTSIILNIIVGFIMKFFIDMYKEMVMQRFMTHHMLQVFEKAKIE